MVPCGSWPPAALFLASSQVRKRKRGLRGPFPISMPPELEQTETIRREISGAQLPSLSLDGLGLLLAVDLLPSPTYLPGPNCLVLETGYVFLLHLSYIHRHFPNSFPVSIYRLVIFQTKNRVPICRVNFRTYPHVHSPVLSDSTLPNVHNLFL